MGYQYTGTQANIDSSTCAIEGAEFKQPTNNTYVHDVSTAKHVAPTKYFHPASIGDVDPEVLEAVLKVGYFDWNTKTYKQYPAYL